MLLRDGGGGLPVTLNDEERNAAQHLGADLWTYWASRGRYEPFHDWEGQR